ncbi:MAG: AAA family ATPase [Ramlibacter sp.]
MARHLVPGADPLRVRFEEFELDEANASLLRGEERLALAPTPFKLLCTLARAPGSLLAKSALVDAVWGHQFVSESVLKTAVSKLRTAMGDDPRQPRIIETVPRRGYRFVAVPSAIAVPQPQPGSAPERAGSTFVGRGDALARLGRAWEAACSGQRTLVWVAGEPGIGKTTLIERFVASVGDVVCVRGHGVEHHGPGEPFLPVLDALSDLCRRDSEVPALLRAVAPTWLLRMPWLSTPVERGALGRELAGIGPDRMLREIGELLDGYCERRPLLLVTEDLHWSDRSTIDLLNYVVRRRGAARLMWLASFRLAEVVARDSPLNRLRHELRVHGLCEEIVLDPFSEWEVAQFVARVSPSLALDEPFVRALHARSDGVPLHLVSLLAYVLARGGGGGDGPGLPAPEQLDALKLRSYWPPLSASPGPARRAARDVSPAPGSPTGSDLAAEVACEVLRAPPTPRA